MRTDHLLGLDLWGYTAFGHASPLRWHRGGIAPPESGWRHRMISRAAEFCGVRSVSCTFRGSRCYPLRTFPERRVYAVPGGKLARTWEDKIVGVDLRGRLSKTLTWYRASVSPAISEKETFRDRRLSKYFEMRFILRNYTAIVRVVFFLLSRWEGIKFGILSHFHFARS